MTGGSARPHAGEGLRLDVGAGADPEGEARRRAELGLPHRQGEGWTTVDAFTPADVCADMWELPLADGSASRIWSSHALEHVALERVAPTLAEWRRVLAPGGLLELAVPDLDYAAAYWLEHPGDPWALAILFGNQAHAGEFHRTGWSAGTLVAALEAAGFEAITVESMWDYGQLTLRAVALRGADTIASALDRGGNRNDHG